MNGIMLETEETRLDITELFNELKFLRTEIVIIKNENAELKKQIIGMKK